MKYQLIIVVPHSTYVFLGWPGSSFWFFCTILDKEDAWNSHWTSNPARSQQSWKTQLHKSIKNSNAGKYGSAEYFEGSLQLRQTPFFPCNCLDGKMSVIVLEQWSRKQASKRKCNKAEMRLFPNSSVVKVSTCQRRRGTFDPWVGKVPCRAKRQPTPVLLPGESHGQKSLVGYSPWGHKE